MGFRQQYPLKVALLQNIFHNLNNGNATVTGSVNALRYAAELKKK